MKFQKSVVICAAMGSVSFLAVPEASAVDVRPHYKIGYDFGGDTLATVTFTNGDSQSVKSGEGFFLGGGISLVTDDKTIETEISISYKEDGIFASNGDLTWSRWPLEGLVF